MIESITIRILVNRNYKNGRKRWRIDWRDSLVKWKCGGAIVAIGGHTHGNPCNNSAWRNWWNGERRRRPYEFPWWRCATIEHDPVSPSFHSSIPIRETLMSLATRGWILLRCITEKGSTPDALIILIRSLSVRRIARRDFKLRS